MGGAIWAKGWGVLGTGLPMPVACLGFCVSTSLVDLGIGAAAAAAEERGPRRATDFSLQMCKRKCSDWRDGPRFRIEMGRAFHGARRPLNRRAGAANGTQPMPESAASMTCYVSGSPGCVGRVGRSVRKEEGRSLGR